MLPSLALTVLVGTPPVAAHEVKLLPYLLGTAPRNEKWLKRRNANDRKKFREATCSFSLVGFLSNLARLTFMFRNIVNSCPQSVKDSAVYQVGEEASLPIKVCLLSVTALFGALAQLARSLTVLVSTCERTATVDEGCAASIETLLVPVTLFINGGIAISAACDKGAVDLPKDIQPNRRLMDPRELPVPRQWDIAQCTVDAVDAARAIAALGLSLDALSRSCPVNYATRFAEKLSTAACTVDVSVLLTSFTRLVFYLALAVNHCSPERERDAICLVGVSAVAAGMSTTSAGGAGVFATCEMGKKNQRRQRLVQAGVLNASDVGAAPATIDSAPFQLIRRLIKRRRLSTSNSTLDLEGLEALWQKMGYNVSDPNAQWLDGDKEFAELTGTMDFTRWDLASQKSLLEFTILQNHSTWEIPCGIDSAASLRSRSGIVGEPMTLEDNVTACQSRCSRIPSCAAFSFWSPAGHCHVLGFLLLPVVDRFSPSTPGWLSGPPSCFAENSKGPAALREMMAQRHEECYASHSMYQPLLQVEPKTLPTVLDCQSWCEGEPQCRFFSYFSLSGLCHLSPADAQKLHPVLNFVAGPKACGHEFIDESTQKGLGMHDAMIALALGQGTFASAMLVVLVCGSVVARKFIAQQRACNFARIEAMVEPDDAVPLAIAGAGP